MEHAGIREDFESRSIQGAAGVRIEVKRMKAENACFKCAKPEKGYDVQAVNAKLRKVAKGPGGRLVESFLCSRCVQAMVNKTDKESPKGES